MRSGERYTTPATQLLAQERNAAEQMEKILEEFKRRRFVPLGTGALADTYVTIEEFERLKKEGKK